MRALRIYRKLRLIVSSRLKLRSRTGNLDTKNKTYFTENLAQKLMNLVTVTTDCNWLKNC